MASVTKLPNGSVRLQFQTADKKRHDLRLGKIPMKSARETGEHIDHLIRVKQTGEEPKQSTREWIFTRLPEFPKIVSKLVELGLVNNGQKQDEVFADFVECLIIKRKDVKPGTTKTWGQALEKIRQHFGRRTIRSLTAKDGKDFLRWLKTPKAEGGAGHKGETPSKHLGHVRGFLNEAVDAEIIQSNPFRSVKAKRTPQQDRRRMIPVEDILRVIEAAPDAEMKAIIALSFWGGLRTPSEHFVLKWSAIRWDENMMTVYSPKTEGVGKEFRETPLFPELLPFLLDLHEVSKHNGPDDYVIQKRRTQSEANLRGRMYRLCIKAGVEKWPKIFQNLRSTRQTILEQFYPRGTVCEWMGNTADVAEGHYIQEMKEFRQQAANMTTTDTREGDRHTTDKNPAKVPQKVPHKGPQGVGRDAKRRTAPVVEVQKKTPCFTASNGKTQGSMVGGQLWPNGSGWESNPPGTR